jgi:tetratricopeptide (TPR) repeat protein
LTELHELFERSRGDAPTLLLRGAAGVGKTSLARRWLADVIHLFPDGQLWADLQLTTGEAVAPEDVQGSFLRALGVSPHRVPAGLAERTALYRSVTADRAVAVLLEDAVSAAQVRVLRPTAPHSLVLVTSRHQLLGLMAEGAQAVSVDALDRAGGIDLLTDAIGPQRVADEPVAAQRLVELCGGLPIALCVVAARAIARPGRSLSRMAEELYEERTRLDVLSVEDELSVRATFDVAYAGLTEPLQMCYRTLGIHPGNRFPAEAVAAAMEIDVATARRQLDRLVEANLLAELGDDYRFHDLVRVHAVDQALTVDSDDVRRVRLRRILEWHLLALQAADRAVMPARRILPYEVEDRILQAGVPVTEPERAIDWLEQHWSTLVAATRDAAGLDLPELTYHFADALQPLVILHNHGREAVEIDELGLQAARTANNTRSEFSMGKRLARLHADLGNLDRAAELAAEMFDRATELRDRRNEASALKTLGQLAIRRGDLAEAERLLTTALDVLRPLERRRSEGLLRIDLGNLLHQAGKYGEAGGQLRQAVTLLSGSNPPDPYNLARAHAGLARVNVTMGDLTQARRLLEQSITVLAEHDADRERAEAHRTFAELARKVGDQALAKRHDDIADDLSRRGDIGP